MSPFFDNAGNVVERYAYDPFGQATALDAGWNTLAASAVGWLYLHQGGRFDTTSELYHFRFRDYSPTQGRWTSLDPIRYAAGDVNLYRVVFNAPTIYTDPSGLDVFDWLARRIGPERILRWDSVLGHHHTGWFAQTSNFAAGMGDVGNLAGPTLVGLGVGPRYFHQGLIAGRPTYNLGGIGEVPGAINVQPPGASVPPEPYVITPSNQLPFPPGSGNVVVNNSPISPQAGGVAGPYGPLGPPYMPGQIASIASGGGRITITQGVGSSGTLTSGQQSVIAVVPPGSRISTVYGPYTTTVTITMPLSYPAWVAS